MNYSIEVIKFETEDIITTSLLDQGDGQQEQGHIPSSEV